MKKLTGMLLLLGMLGTAQANEYWEACSGCSEPQQQRAAILAVPRGAAGIAYVYIMDFERVRLQKYRVETFFARRDDSNLPVAHKVPTEAHIVYEFEQAIDAIQRDIDAFDGDTPIPPEIAPSAYDVIHSGILQEQVSDYINANMNFWQSIGAPVSIPLQALGKLIDLNLFIAVTFSDGSTARFNLKGLEGSLMSIRYKLELQEGSVRDADGNLIPANSAEAAPYSGVFSNEQNAEALVDFVTRWYSREGVGINCYSEDVASGITVTCRRRQHNGYFSKHIQWFHARLAEPGHSDDRFSRGAQDRFERIDHIVGPDRGAGSASRLAVRSCLVDQA